MIWQTTTQTPIPQNIWDVFQNFKLRFLEAVPGLLLGLIILFIFWLFAAIGTRIIAYAAPRVKADTSVVLLLSRIYFYSILILGIVTALSATGLNVSALIAGLGLTGFALGFALKDVLSNLLSGIMLLLYRPFHIGDNITMGSYTGTIQTIRMRDTILLDDEGKTVVIPNSKLITEVVVNNTNSTRTSKPKTHLNTETKPEEESLNTEIRTEPTHEGS